MIPPPLADALAPWVAAALVVPPASLALHAWLWLATRRDRDRARPAAPVAGRRLRSHPGAPHALRPARDGRGGGASC